MPAAAVSPYLLLVLTTLFWSGNFVLGRAVHGEIPALALSFWRWAIALLLVLPLAWPQLRAHRGLLLGHWRSLTLLGVLGITNFNSFVYLGLRDTTATNAVLMVSTAPVLIVLLSFLLLGQRPTPRQALGVAVSLSGVAVIVTRGDWHVLAQLALNLGDAWVFAAVVSWALYSVCLRWRPAGLPPLAFLAATMLTGLLALIPIYLWDRLVAGHVLAINSVTLASIAYVAIFPSVLAYIFWNRAVAELGPNRCGQFLHLMPAFGALLSWLLLDERLYAYHWAGIALIATGLWLATAGRRS